MNPTRYRVLYTVLGLAFVAVVIGLIVLSPSGRDARLPDPVESIAPQDGDVVQRQIALEIDLRPGYAVEVTIDGTAVPPAELQIVEPTGVVTWAPGPGRLYEEWTPGFHVVEISWDRVAGLPDQGSLRWSFRVQ